MATVTVTEPEEGEVWEHVTACRICATGQQRQRPVHHRYQVAATPEPRARLVLVREVLPGGKLDVDRVWLRREQFVGGLSVAGRLRRVTS